MQILLRASVLVSRPRPRCDLIVLTPDFNSFQQPCDQALGYPFSGSTYGYGATNVGQPFGMPFGSSAINPNIVQMSQVDKKNGPTDNVSIESLAELILVGISPITSSIHLWLCISLSR